MKNELIATLKRDLESETRYIDRLTECETDEQLIDVLAALVRTMTFLAFKYTAKLAQVENNASSRT